VIAHLAHGIRQFQVVAAPRRSVTLRVVPTPSFDGQIEFGASTDLEAYLPGVPVKLDLCRDPDRGDGASDRWWWSSVGRHLTEGSKSAVSVRWRKVQRPDLRVCNSASCAAITFSAAQEATPDFPSPEIAAAFFGDGRSRGAEAAAGCAHTARGWAQSSAAAVERIGGQRDVVANPDRIERAEVHATPASNKVPIARSSDSSSPPAGRTATRRPVACGILGHLLGHRGVGGARAGLEQHARGIHHRVVTLSEAHRHRGDGVPNSRKSACSAVIQFPETLETKGI